MKINFQYGYNEWSDSNLWKINPWINVHSVGIYTQLALKLHMIT